MAWTNDQEIGLSDLAFAMELEDDARCHQESPCLSDPASRSCQPLQTCPKKPHAVPHADIDDFCAALQVVDFGRTLSDGMAWDDSLLNVDDAPASATWEGALAGSRPMTYPQLYTL